VPKIGAARCLVTVVRSTFFRAIADVSLMSYVFVFLSSTLLRWLHLSFLAFPHLSFLTFYGAPPVPAQAADNFLVRSRLQLFIEKRTVFLVSVPVPVFASLLSSRCFPFLRPARSCAGRCRVKLLRFALVFPASPAPSFFACLSAGHGASSARPAFPLVSRRPS